MKTEMDICEYIKNRSEKENDLLIDIREKRMVEFGTIPGSINIPIDDIRQLYRLPKESNIYVFCQAGEISGEIAELLSDLGYNACNLTGGYRKYLLCQMEEENLR